MYRKNFPGRKNKRRAGVLARLKAGLPSQNLTKEQRARITTEIAALEKKLSTEVAS
jgi:hypothetical protein